MKVKVHVFISPITSLLVAMLPDCISAGVAVTVLVLSDWTVAPALLSTVTLIELVVVEDKGFVMGPRTIVRGVKFPEASSSNGLSILTTLELDVQVGVVSRSGEEKRTVHVDRVPSATPIAEGKVTRRDCVCSNLVDVRPTKV